MVEWVFSKVEVPEQEVRGWERMVVPRDKEIIPKGGVLSWGMGVYIVMMESFCEPCHVRERWAAQPGMRGVIMVDSGLTMALLRTKAMLAELPRHAGSAELRRWICFANRVSIWRHTAW